MKRMRTKSESGYSLTELLIAVVILVPIMGAAVGLFSVGAHEQASEQSSVDSNLEARSALEIMSTEISQAGSHGDRITTTTAAIGASSNPQSVTLGSAEGMMVGDWLDVDTGANWESVEITAVSGNSVSGVFRTSHVTGTPVRFFALPFIGGMVTASAVAPNSTATVAKLGFFGDINGDSTLQYVEYAYDSANNQITRSITPLTQNSKNAAVPLVRNVKANSVQFRLTSDSQGVVTSANIAMTVQNTVSTASRYQETALSTKVAIPSTMAASELLYELRRYGGVDKLPSTPSLVTTWINQ
jgi:Tfp pilus assembly protein PilW